MFEAASLGTIPVEPKAERVKLSWSRVYINHLSLIKMFLEGLAPRPWAPSKSSESKDPFRPLDRPLVAGRSWIEQGSDLRAEPEHLRYYAGVLRGLYESQYRPPDWVDEWVGSDYYCELAKESICYYSEGSSDVMRLVMRLLLERQPVNIVMRIGYDDVVM